MRKRREPVVGVPRTPIGIYIVVFILVLVLFAGAILGTAYLRGKRGLAGGAAGVIAGTGAATADTPIPVLVEILTDNISYPDEKGNPEDYFELYNPYRAELDISGWGISDSKKTVKYHFPEGTVLPADSYTAFFCSTELEGYIPFGLSAEHSETIYLTNPAGEIISESKTIPAEPDHALVYSGGSWSEVPYATPGYPNTDSGYRQYLESVSGGESGLIFHEVLSSNDYYPNADGITCDYIEFANQSGNALSLNEFTLCSGNGKPVYRFPDRAVLNPGEYFMLYCTRELPEDVGTLQENYCSFAISKQKEEILYLRNSKGFIVDSVTLTPIDANCASGLNEQGLWVGFSFATPGAENTEAAYLSYVQNKGYDGSTVFISEIMPVNGSVIADAKGRFSDWIELYNSGDTAIDLSGWFLSDSDDLLKWKIPSLNIPAGERAVIFCSGDDAVYGSELHTNFSLSANGETITLTTPLGEKATEAAYTNAVENHPFAVNGNGELEESDYATPGYPNNSTGYTAWCESRGTKGPLIISELMGYNNKYLKHNSIYPDWLELKNISDQPVNLSDYYVTKSAKDPQRCQLPDKVLQPGEYFLMYLSSETLKDPKYFTADFGINPLDDVLFLYNASGIPVDYTTIYSIPKGCSFGRSAAGGFAYFRTPTPGTDNGEGFENIAEKPTVTPAGGIYNQVTSVDITLEGTGTIYYTLDGSVPTTKSHTYSEPIHITETTVIRAISVTDGMLNSRVMTETYFVNENHTMPIVSLVSPYDGLFSSNSGIYVKGNYTNYYQNWEREANITLYDTDGKAFSMDCGLKMHGAGSREYCDKKSFKVLFRNKYEGPLNYDVFGDGEVTTFTSLVLRGGEDYRFALLRDDFCGTIAKQASDSLLVQNTRFVILYIDGRYWGIYSIKEQFTEDYYASHMNVSSESVTVQEAPARSGSFLQLVNKVKGMDMTKQANYDFADETFDLNSLMDWIILQVWSGNNDINVNVRYMKSTEGDGKWRWCFFDQDWALYQRPTYKEVFKDNMQHGYIGIRMLKNKTFRDMFCKRVAELCRTTLSQEHVNEVLNSMIEELTPEIERERKRWGFTVGSWKSALATIDAYVNTYNRCQYLIKATINYLGLSKAEQEMYFGEFLNQ